ncbi:hypothetical protein FOCC_FOCC007543 [Frankliniella occidentalis]|nr:hypothetical protein FOCC_FOCC007543 [Frankliniella occidentalis]
MDKEGVARSGAHRYSDGSRYAGGWSERGLKHGPGRLALPDGTRYDGGFKDGMCAGVGVMVFSDGAK